MKIADSAYTSEQIIAAVVVVVLIAVLGFSRSIRKTALVGFDGRASTSRTIALGWTAVIGYMVLTVGLIAASHGESFLDSGLHELGGSYLALLGGPFAGLIGGAAIVGRKVAQGTVQKAQGDFSLADVTRDDAGNVDLVDVQYTLFNLIAAFVLTLMFVRHPAHGMPRFPSQFVALTLGPAGVYLANKAVISNPVRITSLTPTRAAAGDQVIIFGQNFAPTGVGTVGDGDPSAELQDPVVTIGGIPARKVKGAVTGERIIALVPSGLPTAPNKVDVKVTSGSGNEDTSPAALEIEEGPPRNPAPREATADASDTDGGGEAARGDATSNGAPRILRLSRDAAAPRATIAIIGENLIAPGEGSPNVRVGSEPAEILGVPTAEQVVIAIPQVAAGPAELTLSRGDDSTPARSPLEIIGR